MVAKVLIKRTSTPNSPPTALDPGELAVEMADPTKLWVGVPPAIGAPGDMKLLYDSSDVGGFVEAPADSTTYGRNNAAWKREERGANACGLFHFVSATQCRFDAYAGDSIKINGKWYQIPVGGVVVGNAGLAANTLHFAYLYDSGGGVLAIELATAGHATSQTAGNVGTEIKSGIDTHSLIGMICTNATSQFIDTPRYRYVRSWFNRHAQRTDLAGALTTTNSTVSDSPLDIGADVRVYFLTWANEVVTANGMFTAYNTIGGHICFGALNFSSPPLTFDIQREPGAGSTYSQTQNLHMNESNSFPEGKHSVGLSFWTSIGGGIVAGRTPSGPYPSINGQIGRYH